ncbi:MAG TPA: DNA repair protein RecN, partial [Gammaproteobacteria bacterium]|nr:DNA repair protein RecN [Gammaproteobacteria bacterium]
LDQLESQLQAIYDLARKHRIAPHQLMSQLDSLEQALTRLQSLDEIRFTKQQALNETLNAYQKLAKKAYQARSKAAKKLAGQINQELADLGLQHAQFEIRVEFKEQGQPSATGLDDIQFLVSTNPGQPLQALSQIASGGELSRFSLAIQTVLATDNAVPTLIFDEVDTGIGGAVAEMVGQKMQRIGRGTLIV